jgi:hypothetical protein
VTHTLVVPDVALDCLADALARGSVRLAVASGSMRPWLRPGDRVELEPVTLPALRRGDLVALRGASGPRGAGRYVWTKGDAVRGPDAPRPVAELFGRVIRVHLGSGGVRDLGCRRWRVLNRLLGAVALAGVTLAGR